MTLAGRRSARRRRPAGRFVTSAPSCRCRSPTYSMSSSAPGFITASSFANTSFFTSSSLEHRLDHHVAVADVLVGLHRLDQRQPLVHLRLRDAAALDADRVVVASRAACRVSSASCVASRIFTGMPKSAKLMAMPPPMVPAPITAPFSIFGGFRSLRQLGSLADLALGEERVAQAPSLRRSSRARRTARARSRGPLRTAASSPPRPRRCRRYGAFWLRAFRAIDLRIAVEHAGIGLVFGELGRSLSRTRGSGRFVGDALGEADRLAAQVACRRPSRR